MIFCLEESGRSIKCWSCIEAKSQKLVWCQTEWGGKVANAVLNEHRGEGEVRSVVHLLNEKGDEFALHPTLFSWKSWLPYRSVHLLLNERRDSRSNLVFVKFVTFIVPMIGASCFLGCARLCGNQTIGGRAWVREWRVTEIPTVTLFSQGKMGFICSHSRRSFLQPTYHRGTKKKWQYYVVIQTHY